MKLYLVNSKIRVVADGPAGAAYLADKKYNIGIKSAKLLNKNFEDGFRPRVLND